MSYLRNNHESNLIRDIIAISVIIELRFSGIKCKNNIIFWKIPAHHSCCSEVGVGLGVWVNEYILWCEPREITESTLCILQDKFNRVVINCFNQCPVYYAGRSYFRSKISLRAVLQATLGDDSRLSANK